MFRWPELLTTSSAAGQPAPADATDFGGAFPSGQVSFAANETSQTITISVSGDTDTEGDESFDVTLSNASGGATLGNGVASGVIRNDDAGLFQIGQVQGVGEDGALVGTTVTVEAIVVGDFQDNDADNTRNLSGFYLQDEGDGNALTSDGIFIFEDLAGLPDVNVGDRVQVTGTVGEAFGQTQITAGAVNVLQAGAVADINTLAVSVDLDAAGEFSTGPGEYIADLEQYEGMLVTISNTLTINEMFNLDRFNEVKLTTGDRPQQFTQFNDPDVAGYDAYLRDTQSDMIFFDDGLSVQNAPIFAEADLNGDGVFNTADRLQYGRYD